MKTGTLPLLATGFTIVGIVWLLTSGGSSDGGPTDSNVSVVDGTQIIEIAAKGGYTPKVTLAQAGIPTILRVETQGTFDCSAALVIPDADYAENLPSSGVTEVELPAQEPGETVQGLCAMGMFNFEVRFE